MQSAAKHFACKPHPRPLSTREGSLTIADGRAAVAPLSCGEGLGVRFSVST